MTEEKSMINGQKCVKHYDNTDDVLKIKKDYILARIHPGDAMKLRGKYAYQEGDKSYFIKYICVTSDKKNPLVRISFYGDRGVLSEGDEAFDLSVWQLLCSIVC